MPLTEQYSTGRRAKRHSIELHPKIHFEKSVSKAFKIWLGAFAVAIAMSFGVANTPAHSAPTSPAELNEMALNKARLIRPDDMQSGALLFRSTQANRYIEAPKVATDIKIDITGPVARAIVTQKFFNPSEAWLEGIYVFPLPDTAAVDHLKMKVGDRLIEGKIKRRKEARELYEAAKREGKKASLLEQHRPNLFTNAVANIGPKESITIQIEYQQTVPQQGEEFSIRVPLVVAPRYNPISSPLEPVIDIQPNQTGGAQGWGKIDPVPDRNEITPPVLDPDTHAKANPVTLTVDLKAGFALDSVVSHYHDVTLTPHSEGNLTLTLKNETVPADKDFLLTWTGKPGASPNIGLFSQTPSPQADPDTGIDEAKNQEKFLLAYITPPYKLTKTLTAPAREVVFVIDQSGSMAGPSIDQAKTALIEALTQLKPEDRFEVIRFNNGMNQLFGAPKQANAAHIARATSWVRAIQAEGGTEMLPAMQAALRDLTPNAPSLRQVIFLTDGAIGNERQLFESVKSEKGRSRIFTVGIGSAPNSFFMSRAAEVGRGTFTHIGDITEVKTKMSKLFNQLTTPVATDLAITLEGGKGIEASPSDLPDLYLGEPVILTLKAKELGNKLTLSGRFDNQPWSMSIDLANAAPSSAIDKLWARGKIRQLENERLLDSNAEKIDTAIETLGLTHHLVTRLTSLVAVDVTPSRPVEVELESKKVPLNLPDGWDMDAVFGEMEEAVDMASMPAPMTSPSIMPAQAQHAKGMAGSRTSVQGSALLARNAAMTKTPSKLAMAPTGQGQILLPKTATRSNMLILSGIALLLLAGSLLVWLQWRRAK